MLHVNNICSLFFIGINFIWMLCFNAYCNKYAHSQLLDRSQVIM